MQKKLERNLGKPDCITEVLIPTRIPSEEIRSKTEPDAIG